MNVHFRNRKILFSLLLIFWIIFIFVRSLQPGDESTEESQWILDILQKILPFHLDMFFVRKMAHFVEFTVLGVLSSLVFVDKFPKGIGVSLLVDLSTAVCDESIQLFVSGRDGKLPDVWLDVSGCVSGLLVVCLILALINKYKGTNSTQHFSEH